MTGHIFPKLRIEKLNIEFYTVQVSSHTIGLTKEIMIHSLSLEYPQITLQISSIEILLLVRDSNLREKASIGVIDPF
jgi:hypothetical protein